jgi:hypothetical protein
MKVHAAVRHNAAVGSRIRVRVDIERGERAIRLLRAPGLAASHETRLSSDRSDRVAVGVIGAK